MLLPEVSFLCHLCLGQYLPWKGDAPYLDGAGKINQVNLRLFLTATSPPSGLKLPTKPIKITPLRLRKADIEEEVGIYGLVIVSNGKC